LRSDRISIACSFSVPMTTGRETSLPLGKEIFALCFSAMASPTAGSTCVRWSGGRAGPPLESTQRRLYPRLSRAWLLERHERRLAERRRKPIRVAEAEVARRTTPIEPDVHRARIVERAVLWLGQGLGVDVEAEHQREHVLVARAERQVGTDLR